MDNEQYQQNQQARNSQYNQYSRYAQNQTPLYQPAQTSIPFEYRQMSPWGYVGYSLLFSIAIVGLIFLIIYALDDTYICRRNFARGYLLFGAISIAIAILSFLIIFVFALSLGSM